MRLFVAAEIPASVRDTLGQVQTKLRQRIAGAGQLRWVAPERIHLTLKFLGNVDASWGKELPAVVATAVRDQPAFDLGIGGLGIFPNARAAKVLWVGLTGDLDALARLRDRVEEAMVGAGLPAEARPFRAHLTLARVPDGVHPHETAGAAAAEDETIGDAPTRFSIERVGLVHSVLGAEGPTYRTLATAELARR